ncbi:FG-GAP repeat domain-containing protein [Albidovulum aquaemixtae]|nr:VCBS repeat-containing protein [Defluviimonas aquaemixtae]
MLGPVALALALLAGRQLAAAGIVAADYAGPTMRYPHGALGDTIEHDTLSVRLDDGRRLAARFPDTIVFEDTAPRLADLDGDGLAEVIVVESHEARGARLAVWGLKDGKLARLAATPFIGRRFRWLAPAGAADLDGDRRIEIAYVETPHLGKKLKIVRLEGDRLVPVAEAEGLTNHRIGEPFIEGGIAHCDGRPTILLANAGWTRIIGALLDGGEVATMDRARYRGPDSFNHVPGCD